MLQQLQSMGNRKRTQRLHYDVAKSQKVDLLKY